MDSARRHLSLWNVSRAWLGAPLVVFVMLAALSVGATPALEPGAWALGAGALLALGVLAFVLPASRLGRGPAFRRHVDRLDLPAVASTVGGRVLHANAAMRELCGAPGSDLARTLAHGLDVAPPAIYRLATAARRTGFGFEAMRARADAAPLFLVSRVLAPDVIVWTVVPPERMPATEPVRSEENGAASIPAEDDAEDGADDTGGAPEALDALPVALVQFDSAGHVRWSNAHAREIVGRELVPGTSLADLVEPLGRPLDLILSETASRTSSRREMVRLRGGAEDTFLHIALTPVILDGTPSLLAVLSDASELRHLEDKFAQSQKMEAVGKLAGGVAHDFNNVLTAISGHCDLLLMGKDVLHPDYSDLMQVRQNTHRAAALVRQLLAFSRKQTLKPQLLSVQDVVSDTQYLLNRLIGEKISLTVEHGSDLWNVRADQQQLEQALMNLVVNARDAMPDGGTIMLATRNVTLAEPREHQNVEVPDGSYVEISVSDSGTGIQPQAIDRIFEPFFTTKARGEGTGLGLSTVYGIVKQSGGYIFAENRAEGGARFRILLPRARAQDAEESVGARVPVAERRDLTGKGVVLLVEDEDPVRSFASRALRLRGYEVLEAASAEQGMELLAEPGNHVDVLVSDVVMPGMDGPTFAAEARRMRPGLRVVFVSGYAEDSFRRTLMDREFLFLPKPFSLTDLTAKVKEALGQAA